MLARAFGRAEAARLGRSLCAGCTQTTRRSVQLAVILGVSGGELVLDGSPDIATLRVTPGGASTTATLAHIHLAVHRSDHPCQTVSCPALHQEKSSGGSLGFMSDSMHCLEGGII